MRLLYWVVSLLALLATGCGQGGEKTIEHPIPRLYGAEDAQFSRTMGALLGPGILEGNRLDVLLNGDQIFPAIYRQSEMVRKPLRSRPTSIGLARSASNLQTPLPNGLVRESRFTSFSIGSAVERWTLRS